MVKLMITGLSIGSIKDFKYPASLLDESAKLWDMLFYCMLDDHELRR